jgi:hypothetical protein
MLLHVALVRTDVSEELSVSFIRVVKTSNLRSPHPLEKTVENILMDGSD